jgi:hypothetical protein
VPALCVTFFLLMPILIINVILLMPFSLMKKAVTGQRGQTMDRFLVR